jgi:hypothetical protein
MPADEVVECFIGALEESPPHANNSTSGSQGSLTNRRRQFNKKRPDFFQNSLIGLIRE